MERDQGDPNDEYSRGMKEYIVKKVTEKGSEDVQMLEDLVRKIIYEQRQKKNKRQQHRVNTGAIQLSKRKIKNQIEQRKTQDMSKQKTLTDFILKPKPKFQVVEERPKFQYRSKKQMDVFESAIANLKRPKRSTRSKRSSQQDYKFPSVKPPKYASENESLIYLSFHDSYYYIFGAKRPDKSKIDYTHPLGSYEGVDYQVNSQDEYEEIKCDVEGEQITGDDPKESDDSMCDIDEQEQSNDFCVSDGHLSADELSSTHEKRVEINLSNTAFLNEWNYRWKDAQAKVPEQSEIHCIEGNLPLYLEKQAEFTDKHEGHISDIHQACHKNSRAQIITTLKNDFAIEKQEAVDYINTFCHKKVVEKKTVYLVKTLREQNQLQGIQQQSISMLNQSRKSQRESPEKRRDSQNQSKKSK